MEKNPSRSDTTTEPAFLATHLSSNRLSNLSTFESSLAHTSRLVDLARAAGFQVQADFMGRDSYVAPDLASLGRLIAGAMAAGQADGVAAERARWMTAPDLAHPPHSAEDCQTSPG